MVKKGQLVHLVWFDAEAQNEWKEEKDLMVENHDSTRCETVGWVVKAPTKKEPMWVIASTKSKGDKGMDYNQIFKIPAQWVKETDLL